MTQPHLAPPVVPASLVARTTAVEAPDDLLDLVTPNGFSWISDDGCFVASGIAARVAPADAVRFLQSIVHRTTAPVPAAAGPRAVGALPFRGPGLLTVPARIVARDASGHAWQTDIDGIDVPPPLRATAPAPHNFRVHTHTEERAWRAMVEHALELIAGHALEKVVLARAVSVEADQLFAPPTVLRYLRATQPGCIVYGDGGFVGASPELLVRVRGTEVLSRPLAGTGDGPDALLHSPKDAREHQLVVDAVVHTLAAHCADVRADGPTPIQLANVAHFATTVRARLRADASALDLVAALHPTPAVAGTPTSTALDTIAMLERSPRGRYAGPCGWVDARGDGEFVVALRGGELDGNRAVLHAGAGIVAGSEPGAEWAETQAKLAPMLHALVRP
jgi:menaquinone-specific isochorismate synthase